jgi:hypothetical protein
MRTRLTGGGRRALVGAARTRRMHLPDGGGHEFSLQVSLGVRRPGLGRGGRAGDGRPPARRSSPTGCRSCGRTSTWSVHPTWSDFATPCGASTRTRFRAVVDEVARGLAGPLPDAHARAAEGSPADVLLRESHGGPAGRGQPWARRLPHHAARLDEHPACVMHARCPVTVVHPTEGRRHRLRVHRERQDGQPDEHRDGVDALPETGPPR